jgi:hypothetical protein
MKELKKGSAVMSLRTIEHQITLHLTKPDAWDLLWHPEGQSRWLGPDSCMQLRAQERVTLCDESGSWREGTVLSLIPCEEVRMSVVRPLDWGVSGRTLLRIRLTDTPGRPSCLLSIEERLIPDPFVRAVERYWSRRKQLLEKLDHQIQKRRKNPRQAVVLFHGIGEQQPGEILNSFLSSGVLGRTSAGVWVKPDRLSDLFELRMATISGNSRRPTTDVYEAYWAHLIRDTKLNHVLAWLSRLLLRWPLRLESKQRVGVRKGRNTGDQSLLNKKVIWTIPSQLTPVWLLIWGFLLMFPVVTIGKLMAWSWALQVYSWLIWLSALPFLLTATGGLWRFLGIDLATNYLGDAARYLSPHPDNIDRRQAIRSDGVRLLEKLHNSGKYDRIVVVGHSLGSVIAYDILSHAWVKMHRDHRRPTTRSRMTGDGPFRSLRRVERAAANKKGTDPQKLQHQAWLDLRINTQPWLVTDFVTLGSPLTYTDFLLADGARSLQKLKRNRSMPICPPWLDKVKDRRDTRPGPYLRFSYETEYPTAIGNKQYTFSCFNHGALFAVTRWTNLYVPSDWLGLSGDVISGKLGGDKRLGSWIVDLPLRSHWPMFMHTWYWNDNRGPLQVLQDWFYKRDLGRSRIETLKYVMNLNSRRELATLLKQIPAYTLLT